MAIRVCCKDEIFLYNDFIAVREKLLSLAKEAGDVLEVSVELDGGSYSLSDTFSLSASENAELKSLRIHFSASAGEQVEIHSLSSALGREFKKVEGAPYYVYRFSPDKEGKYPVFRCLYHGGERMKFSASPIYRNPFARLPEEIRGEKELKGLYVPYEIAEKLAGESLLNTEVFMYVQWEYLVVRAKSVDLSDTVMKDGVKYALVTFLDDEFEKCYIKGVHSLNNTGNRPTFFQNSVAFLEKGGFAYRHETGELFVYPDDNTDMETAEFFYPSLDTLFRLEGLVGISFEGITFTGAGATFLSRSSYIAPLSNVIKKLPHAAILGKNMRDFSVNRCAFRALGCNGIQLNGRTVTVKIANSRFTDVGGFGIAIGGYEGGTWQLPNPLTADESLMRRFFATATYDTYIENNYFEHIAYDYPNSAAIYFGSVDGAKILHNTVIDCAYSGISLGWGWQAFFVPGELFNLRAVEIAYNRVHDFMQLLRDGGAIYTYGANSITSHASRFNCTHHNFASLSDAGDHDKRGYYLDCSTSNWDVYDNVIDNCFIPYFAQYHVKHENPHHVRLDRNYSTTPIDARNHAPERDVLMRNAFYKEGTIEELFEAYPAAKEICDNAGCRL